MVGEVGTVGGQVALVGPVDGRAEVVQVGPVGRRAVIPGRPAVGPAGEAGEGAVGGALAVAASVGAAEEAGRTLLVGAGEGGIAVARAEARRQPRRRQHHQHRCE
jgi:hypothetical protein